MARSRDRVGSRARRPRQEVPPESLQDPGAALDLVHGRPLVRGVCLGDRAGAEGCEDEYEQAKYAFTKLIARHVDQRMAKKVLNRNWLPPDTTPVRVKGTKASAKP